MRGAKDKAMIPDIPQPSSRTVESESRTSCLKKTLEGDVTQDANRGVIFQTTADWV